MTVSVWITFGSLSILVAAWSLFRSRRHLAASQGGRSGWDSSTNAVRGEPLTRPTAPARWQGPSLNRPPGCISPVRSEAPPGGGKLQQDGNVRVMQRVIILLRNVNGQPETAAHWGP
jgi:hypothetical protein